MGEGDRTMSSDPRNDKASLSLAAVQRIDQICDRFEDACKAGQRPSVEEFLGDISEPERSILLRELMALETNYRVPAGDNPQEKEYRDPARAGADRNLLFGILALQMDFISRDALIK